MLNARIIAVIFMTVSLLSFGAAGASAAAADSTPPDVFPTAPQDGSSVSGANVTVSAAASDNVGVVGVQFKLDGANLGNEVTTSPYSIIWDTRQTPNGAHAIKAVARDAAGNSATSFSITVTVSNASDATPPVVTLIAPAAGSTVSGSSVKVSAAASDNVGVAGVQFKLDGANLGAEVLITPFTATFSVVWNSLLTANGSHSLTAVARDAAGNQTTSAAVTVTVNNATEDTTPPSVSLIAPVNGAPVSGSSVTVSASASDDVGVVGVQFKLDGVNLGLEDSTPPYSILWDSRQTANGSHGLTAVARDAAGNQTTSPTVTVTVTNTTPDTTPPTVSLASPTAGATVSGSSVAVSASASDNVGVVGVQFKLDGVNLGAEAVITPYSMIWDTRQTANGSHTLTAVARDNAGNQTTSLPVTVTVSNTTADTTPPSVSLTSPTNGSAVSGSAVTVSASASDNVGVAGVQFKLDGINLGAEDTVAPYSTSWDTRQAANGSHTLTATARDAAGNQTTSPSVAVTVNNTTPDATPPTVSIIGPAANSVLSGSGVTISAAASDNVGVIGVQFKVDGANLGSEDAVTPYTIVWNTTTYSNGPHTLTAVARDAAGNQTTSSAVAVSVNNQDPNAAPFSITDRGGDSWTAASSGDAIATGYLRVQTSAGAAAPTGVAVIGYRNKGVLVSEAGVPASPTVSSGRIYVDIGGAVNTGVAIANPNNTDSLITFYFDDVNGNIIWYGSVKVCAGCQMAGFLNQRPFYPVQSFRGTFTFYASNSVAVIALRGFTNERNEFLITTLPVSPLTTSSAPSLTLPEFADGGGWSTQVILMNPTESPISGTVGFWSPGTATGNGVPLAIGVNGGAGSSFPYTIPSLGAVRFVTSNTSPQVQVGSVRITAGSSSVIPQALAIFSLKANDFTISEASVPGSVAGAAFRTYVEFSPADQIDAGVAIANASVSPASVNLEITTLDGLSAGVAASVQIPAGGQITKFVSELFPGLPSGLTGVLRITSPTPVSVIGLRARFSERGTFLITTIPVSNESATTSPSTEIVFPQVVSGGGYSTDLILFSSGPGATAVGNLRFFNPDGTAAVRLSH